MTFRALGLAASLLLAPCLFALACSSSSSGAAPAAGTGGGSGAGGSSAGGAGGGASGMCASLPNTMNCVPPGTGPNDKNVGAYCEPSECKGVSPCLLCTADFGAPANNWFCTKSCSKDDDCGTGAYCDHSDPKGSGCVPLTCGTPADAGTMDATND